jgi:hypothetical protein
LTRRWRQLVLIPKTFVHLKLRQQRCTQLSGYRYNRIANTYLQGFTVTNAGAALNGMR